MADASPLSFAAPKPNPVPETISSDESYSSSGGEDVNGQSASSYEETILSAYLQTTGSSAPADLSKIRSFLASASGHGGLLVSCLICLGRIRPSDPSWSCSTSCHAIFHLPCIQSWAQQSSHRPAAPHLPNAAPDSGHWPCPKCRLAYPRSDIPRSYLCFCGKLEDPPVDPWIFPHSCGDICGRPLAGECGHHCLLLCHPGPCPPCPKLVTASCFCGRIQDARRCAHKLFSCSKSCQKPLPCGSHCCSNRCHNGPCPPCRITGFYKCACKKTQQERECWEQGFRCEQECGGTLRCGKHRCERGCHGGICGDCPLQGRRTCPCGKKEHRGMACDVEAQTCGSTCEKMLGCGIHRCPERCHRGQCVETCRIVITKSCKCGSLKKEVPCYQDLVCERKCQRMRDCGRHSCRRRCCDGNCPPCPEICGRKLHCNNHKCPSPCHRGVCVPCPLMVSVSCSCGKTHFEVPCGVERDQKPPKCPKPCQVAYLCRHKSERRHHKCHYGACPPCKMICGEDLSCGHSCKQRCHGPVPSPLREFSLKPKKEKGRKHVESSSGSPCLPCEEIVWKSCLGQHVGEERAMLCSHKTSFSCQNYCGSFLPCGNHFCTKLCHAVTFKSQSLSSDSESKRDLTEFCEEEPCEECSLPCQKIREPPCPHACPLMCHSSTCPPCKVLIKRSCHCGALVHAFECIFFNKLSEEEQQKVRTCGGPCHRKLPNCPHLCSEICHPGHCPSADQCSKKVTVRCACNNLKKDWLCRDVVDTYCNSGRDPKEVSRNQFGSALLPCSAECKVKLKVVDSELQLRKTKAVQNTAEITDDVPKRKKRRDQVQEIRKHSMFKEIRAVLWRILLCIFIFLLLISVSYCCYQGIFLLSDWMNKMEEEQMRRRLGRA